MGFLSLEGRVAVVTGAAQGIGLAVAQRFVKARASVAIVDVNLTAAKEAAGHLIAPGASTAHGCDVSDPDAVGRMFDEVLHTYDRVDILVNNAGIGGRFAPIQEQRDEDWRRVLEVDLSGVFYCCRAIIPHMVQRRFGRIINVSSIAGKDGSPDMVPYSSAKAGVIGLTKALAKEVAKYNVLVNAFTPAIIETPLLEEMPAETRQRLLERTPMARFGRAEEAAAMIHWLASDDIGYSTGAVFDLSGGRATY